MAKSLAANNHHFHRMITLSGLDYPGGRFGLPLPLSEPQGRATPVARVFAYQMRPPVRACLTVSPSMRLLSQPNKLPGCNLNPALVQDAGNPRGLDYLDSKDLTISRLIRLVWIESASGQRHHQLDALPRIRFFWPPEFKAAIFVSLGSVAGNPTRVKPNTIRHSLCFLRLRAKPTR